MSIELNKGQIYACYDLENWWHNSTKQLIEIEGAAGTGKTTMIIYFIEKIGLELSEVLFVSYMGKAVSQMIRNGLPAKTIHSACYDCVKKIARDEDGKIIFLPNGKPKTYLDFELKEKIPGKPKLIVIDEARMVPEKNALDLLSFGIPIIALGDTNQLPPVFGKPFFLESPDIWLTEIMRQKEGDPIIYLSQQILHHEKLRPCVLGKSCVIERKYFTREQMIDSDIIITASNKLRGAINDLFRENILSLKTLDYPNFGEKIICRRNNWSRYVKDRGEIYLTNGLAGFVDGVNKSSYNGKSMKIDFRPDFTGRVFHDLKINLEYINTSPGENRDIFIGNDMNVFEYAYAITCHLSQGSQYDRVTLLQEKQVARDEDYFTKLMYTGITRARDAIRIVI